MIVNAHICTPNCPRYEIIRHPGGVRKLCVGSVHSNLEPMKSSQVSVITYSVTGECGWRHKTLVTRCLLRFSVIQVICR